jgi:hypothetical protein
MRKLIIMVLTVMAVALSVGAASLASADTALFSGANQPESILLFGTGLLIVGRILRQRSAGRA